MSLIARFLGKWYGLHVSSKYKKLNDFIVNNFEQYQTEKDEIKRVFEGCNPAELEQGLVDYLDENIYGIYQTKKSVLERKESVIAWAAFVSHFSIETGNNSPFEDLAILFNKGSINLFLADPIALTVLVKKV